MNFPHDTLAGSDFAMTSAVADRVSLMDISRLVDINAPELLELVDYGVLVPCLLHNGTGNDVFEPKCIAMLQQADRMRNDLALNFNEFALAVMLFEKIVDLQQELLVARGHASLPA